MEDKNRLNGLPFPMTDEDCREIFNVSDDALFIHEVRTGKILDVNPRTSELFGYSKAEILEMSIADISSNRAPFDEEHAVEYIRAAINVGGQSFEWMCRKKSGELFWCYIVLKQVYLRGELRILATVRDISDRKRMDEHASLLSSLVEQSSEGVALIDVEGEIIYINCAFANMHGYEPNELIGKHISIFHNEEQMKLVEKINDGIRDGVLFSGEVWHVRRNGTPFPTLMHNSMFKDGEGDYVGMIGLARDISEQKRAEAALSDSEERYRSLVDLSPDAIVVHLDGKIVYVNRAGITLFGIDSIEDIVGRPLLDFVHPDYHDLVLARVERTYARDWVGECIEEKMLCVDGETLDVEVAVGPITYNGKHAAQVVIRDITARKVAEDKLRLYSEDLEDMVRGRTQELDRARSKLFHSSKLAAVGRLGASVAHQLNSPICGGLLFVDALLEDYKNSKKQVETLEILKKSLLGMRDVIDCTLSMAMVSRDGRPANDYIDLNEALSRVLDMSSLELKRQNVFAKILLDPDLPKIPATVGELDQIFINIVHNAMDAMPDGGDLTVASESVGDGILISITDTGRGMPEEQLAQIFEPFFTTRMAERGIGLGLAIARDIVEKYGGEIDAESEMGSGTTFHIRLPLKCDIDPILEETPSK